MPGISATTKPSAYVSKHHGEYYIEGADLVVRVENTLFCIHRFFLTRDSSYFRDSLKGKPTQGPGSSDNDPLVLDNVLEVDFECLLWVFYNPKYSIYNASVEKWSSILKLANKWDFVEVKELAVRELQNIQIPPIQKIVIYQTYSIDRNLLQPAFTALTTRDEPISIQEGRELTLETALPLARARELARAPVLNGKKSGNPRSPVNLAGIDLDSLIKDVFELPPSPASSNTAQTTSTVRGTATGGRDTPQPSSQTKWFDPFGFNSLQPPESPAVGLNYGQTNGRVTQK
ncbi:hypothetical protein BC827DRAFT_1265398 [Russula dissimulans]|nr:hypothetical protein BC827DRAFT_1265398 [Russula dissimulans]